MAINATYLESAGVVRQFSISEANTLCTYVLEYMANTNYYTNLLTNKTNGNVSYALTLSADSSAPSAYNTINIGTVTDTRLGGNVGTSNITVFSTSTPVYQIQDRKYANTYVIEGTAPGANSFIGLDVTGNTITLQSKLSTLAEFGNTALQLLVNDGPGSYYLGNTSPGSGTWVSIATFNDQTDGSGTAANVNYLWVKLDNGSPSTLQRPLYLSSSNELVEYNDADIAKLIAYIENAFINTGVGTYVIQSSAPVSGTWVAKGTIVDTRATTATAATYEQAYITNFSTGSYSGPGGVEAVYVLENVGFTDYVTAESPIYTGTPLDTYTSYIINSFLSNIYWGYTSYTSYLGFGGPAIDYFGFVGYTGATAYAGAGFVDFLNPNAPTSYVGDLNYGQGTISTYAGDLDAPYATYETLFGASGYLGPISFSGATLYAGENRYDAAVTYVTYLGTDVYLSGTANYIGSTQYTGYAGYQQFNGYVASYQQTSIQGGTYLPQALYTGTGNYTSVNDYNVEVTFQGQEVYIGPDPFDTIVGYQGVTVQYIDFSYDGPTYLLYGLASYELASYVVYNAYVSTTSFILDNNYTGEDFASGFGTAVSYDGPALYAGFTNYITTFTNPAQYVANYILGLFEQNFAGSFSSVYQGESDFATFAVSYDGLPYAITYSTDEFAGLYSQGYINNYIITYDEGVEGGPYTVEYAGLYGALFDVIYIDNFMGSYVGVASYAKNYDTEITYEAITTLYQGPGADYTGVAITTYGGNNDSYLTGTTTYTGPSNYITTTPYVGATYTGTAENYALEELTYAGPTGEYIGEASVYVGTEAPYGGVTLYAGPTSYIRDEATGYEDDVIFTGASFAGFGSFDGGEWFLGTFLTSYEAGYVGTGYLLEYDVGYTNYVTTYDLSYDVSYQVIINLFTGPTYSTIEYVGAALTIYTGTYLTEQDYLNEYDSGNYASGLYQGDYDADYTTASNYDSFLSYDISATYTPDINYNLTINYDIDIIYSSYSAYILSYESSFILNYPETDYIADYASYTANVTEYISGSGSFVSYGPIYSMDYINTYDSFTAVQYASEVISTLTLWVRVA